MKAKCRKNAAKEKVLLETVTATPLVDQFLLERPIVEVDRQPQERVDVLERDRQRVMKMNRCECLERGHARSRVANPHEVGIQVRGLRGDRCILQAAKAFQAQKGSAIASRSEEDPRCSRCTH